MMTRDQKSARTVFAAIGGVGLALGLGGCMAFAGASIAPMPIAASAPRGFVLKSVVAIQEEGGVRFHGALCRRTALPAPVRIRVDRIDASGQILASASRPVSGLRSHEHHCTFFDVPTVGAPRPGEGARVCAQRSVGPCADVSASIGAVAPLSAISPGSVTF